MVENTKLKMRILVSGQNGQLGRALLSQANQIHDFPYFDLREINFLDQDQLFRSVESLRPEALINTAAFTDVDNAETQIELAKNLNTLLPGNLAKVCNNLEIPFFQISTDYVFSGLSNSPWQVNSPTNPINVYGATKLAGEKSVSELCPQEFRIFRTSWLYSRFRKNFAKTMVRFALRDHQNINVVSDQIGQPTSALDLAKQLIQALEMSLKPGIYHATNSGSTTWYEFAKEIFDLLGEDSNRVLPVKSSNFKRPAVRPTYSVLSHDCWLESGLAPMRDWKDAIVDTIEGIKTAVISEGV